MQARIDDLEGRLNDIFQAQRYGGPEFGMPEVTPFVVVGFYLDPADLEAIRPLLLPRDPDLEDLGDIGRYRSIPVYRKNSPEAAARPPGAEYRGVGFRYCAVDHVFM
jgi:hypothetical protein